ncbi:hypothetical protein [Amycolatopsis sp. Hca4]|uniref:hypothetical protein n=1 Tax=Amycolatopsis sp. Hca4 TaxID=2742131 RepID=UPI001592992D|nr:hypothetical protein [Amycolatopsis sp. Hca4]QKV79744.1 hypothetical protein HUT10_42565 [Amycolatopsis sp. Hca4]
MLGELGQQMVKLFSGRFNLTNLLPVTLLAALVSLLVAAGAYTDHPTDIVAVVDHLRPVQAGLVVIGIVLAGVLLRPFQVALVQFLEGYWRTRALTMLQEVATEQHRRRRHSAKIVSNVQIPDPEAGDFEAVVMQAQRTWRLRRAAGRASQALQGYPKEGRLMPTQIGNVLRVGEDAAGDRYGLELNAITERLWPSLSPTISGSISRNLEIIDMMCAVCVALTAATAVSLPVLWHPSGWTWVPLFTTLTAAVAYRAALRAATGHARLLAAAVDLHRFDMLTALHLPLPPSIAEEIPFNKALSRFLRETAGTTPLAFPGMVVPYEHPSATASNPDETA